MPHSAPHVSHVHRPLPLYRIGTTTEAQWPHVKSSGVGIKMVCVSYGPLSFVGRVDGGYGSYGTPWTTLIVVGGGGA